MAPYQNQWVWLFTCYVHMLAHKNQHLQRAWYIKCVNDEKSRTQNGSTRDVHCSILTTCQTPHSCITNCLYSHRSIYNAVCIVRPCVDQNPMINSVKWSSSLRCKSLRSITWLPSSAAKYAPDITFSMTDGLCALTSSADTLMVLQQRIVCTFSWPLSSCSTVSERWTWCLMLVDR